jgi:hypothetical protein
MTAVLGQWHCCHVESMGHVCYTSGIAMTLSSLQILSFCAIDSALSVCILGACAGETMSRGCCSQSIA